MKDRWEEGKSDEARYPRSVGLTGRPLRVELSQAVRQQVPEPPIRVKFDLAT